jgi:hypothetical protein
LNTITASPSFRLGVRPGSPHWQILCTPGHLATLFQHLAQLPAPIPVEEVQGHSLACIPLTPELDRALVHLVDTLIDLRYQSGKVQLELFAPEVE